MTTYDWIVIGGGITGSALAYELSTKSLKVLLLEKDIQADNATVYSYGGLAYWSGTTPLTRQLGQEGIELHRNLATELDADTEFCELDLLLTVNADNNPAIIAKNFKQFAIQPEILNTQEACQLEPLLNHKAISGVLKLPHGQVNAQKTALAYQQALTRNNGIIKYENVTDFVRQQNEIQGVITTDNTYHAANTVVCAGGLTHSLLKKSGIPSKTYFTHAQVIKTAPIDLKLNSIIMPAIQERFILEDTGKDLEEKSAWEYPDNEIVKSILDAGAVQLDDRSLFLGQISTIITNPHYTPDIAKAEQQIRQSIAQILPELANIPGTCHHCLVAFNTEKIATIGNLSNLQGIYLFSGFTSTIVFAPPLAKRFANWVAGETEPIIEQLNL
ncbi:FAD dependent oxidoreductase [Hyella patelloides LEGE 07179]|uniref:FAD dependent oxidoreductase n=1 Tax=Hyella patelloides LEGE 07179 TaxID=945734 RepID=A0A563VKJ4_9CYAN|nr:FAD-binding oxidoreductase [Hyella patelloides]VEP11825.1 FAD dependent oxidoreductase [Hyella patelloides LEGE 07179]